MKAILTMLSITALLILPMSGAAQDSRATINGAVIDSCGAADAEPNPAIPGGKFDQLQFRDDNESGKPAASDPDWFALRLLDRIDGMEGS